MLNSAAIARPLRVSEMYHGLCRMDDAGPRVVQFLDRVRDQNANSTSPLNRYIEGWVQIDLEKILDATAPSYRFTDPFVGSFDGRSLHKYFDLLQDRLSCTGAISRRELAFFLQGPMQLRSHKELQFWREAPRIGLTGVTEIEIGERGVAAERVAYDLNLASDILCRALACADPKKRSWENTISNEGRLPTCQAWRVGVNPAQHWIEGARTSRYAET